mgnify:CR=1 FL=1
MNERKYCYRYPHPAVTTDCVIFGYDGSHLKVLLIERAQEPYKGKWAFPGGFVNIDESCEDGAARELEEETGMTGAYIKQLGTFSDPLRDTRERVITVAYYALVRIQEVRAGDDAAKAQWFDIDALPPLAFDHEKIMDTARRRLRERIYFEPIVFELLPEQFTISQLQYLYEHFLGTSLDSRNFARKMLRHNILRRLEKTACNAGEREAHLYIFDADCYNTLKQKGNNVEF